MAAVEPLNRQFRLASRPVGLPRASDWTLEQAPPPRPAAGEVLVRVQYISLDPAMRGWMNEGRSYIQPVAIGDVMRALGAGEVIASESPDLAVGEYVTGLFGVQEYAVAHPAAVGRADISVAPLPVYLSALGMPGMTAYFGLLDIGKPTAGETVVVSGAAGAVGSLVGQIAKLKGARAVGIAGGPEKCSYIVQELGFDAAIDYKAQDVPAGLAEHCPEGVDVYFDNVGGPILDAALARLARRARVVICGAISQYNALDAVQGPANYLSLLVNHASMTGFVVSDYGDRLAEGLAEMAGWLAAGRISSREDIVEGIEAFPEALLRLFSGENNGKLELHVGD
ncbi:MAG TPA: NADP-dependent oxidoreductase [Solirubrobacteraceae bacterium]|nr:NADP-dependent oxidoreductase [Solirubrobacteraceae bacterium]